MRLFVAVVPPAEALRELAAAVAPLRRLPGAERVRWTTVEGWHVTLVFLGEVAQEQLPELTGALGQVAGEHPRHRLRLAGGGRFGDRTLWVGLEGETRVLRALAQGVQRVAADVGCADRESVFRAHLTLARSTRGGLRGPAAELEGFWGSEWVADQVRLMRSESTGGRAHYTTVRRWPLAQG